MAIMWDEVCLGVPLSPTPSIPTSSRIRTTVDASHKELYRSVNLHCIPSRKVFSIRPTVKTLLKEQVRITENSYLSRFSFNLFLFVFFFSPFYLFLSKNNGSFLHTYEVSFSSLAKISELMEQLWPGR